MLNSLMNFFGVENLILHLQKLSFFLLIFLFPNCNTLRLTVCEEDGFNILGVV